MALLNNSYSRTTSRRVGLSNRERAPHLLSSFQQSPPVKPPIKALKVPKGLDDPPLSSDEEDSQLGVQTPISGAKTPQRKTCAIEKSETPFKKISEVTRPPVDDSSSEDEFAIRHDIQRTSFTTAKQGEAVQRKTRSKRKESLAESAKDIGLSQSKRQRSGEHISAKRREEAAPNAPTSSGEHFTNAQGFIQTKKSKRTYKKRSSSSQEQVTRKGEDKKKAGKIKIPEDPILSTPEKPKASKLVVPPETFISLPRPKASAELVLVSDLEDVNDKTSAKTSGLFGKPPELDRTPSPAGIVSKIVASSTELELRTVLDKKTDLSLSIVLSEADSSSAEELDSRGQGQDQVAAKPAAVCPWCGEEVDTNLLQEFSKGKRLNVRLQTKFCQKHKKKTAEEVWQQKEYPRVEWDSIDRRFALHSDRLLAIINGSSSHFRTIHEKNIESGKARSMKKEGNMNPGYYGPRGFNIMCDYLVEKFGGLLKKKAVDDKVIAGRGSASFIQNVLVAELAVQMIREDMRVSQEEAIVILEDSKALGELIHEEV